MCRLCGARQDWSVCACQTWASLWAAQILQSVLCSTVVTPSYNQTKMKLLIPLQICVSREWCPALSSVQLLGLIRVIIEGIVESLVLVANDDVQDFLQSIVSPDLLRLLFGGSSLEVRLMSTVWVEIENDLSRPGSTYKPRPAPSSPSCTACSPVTGWCLSAREPFHWETFI